MSIQEELLDLEPAVRQISKGVNALVVMSMGLGQAVDPYADGFDALSDYLVQADRKLQKQFEACMNAI